MFTGGIPILGNSGLFSLEGCMMVVPRKGAAALCQRLYLCFDAPTPTARLWPHPRKVSSRLTAYDASEQNSITQGGIGVYDDHLVFWGQSGGDGVW